MLPKELLRSFIIYGLGTGLSQSILIFLVPVYANYFSTDEYGALEIIVSMGLFVSIMTMLQIESAVGRFYFEHKDLLDRKAHISTGFWSIFIVSSIICGVLLLLSERITQLLFSSSDFWLALFLAVLTVPVANLFNYFNVLIRYEKKPVIYSVITLTQVSSTIFLSILLVIVFDFGIAAVFIGQLTGYFIGLISYIYYFKQDIFRNIDITIWKKYLHFSLPTIPAVLSAWGNNHANRFAMLSLLSLGEIGIYMVAYKIASVFKLLEIAFRMAWQPFFIEHYKHVAAPALFKRIVILLIVVLSVLVLLSFLIGPWALRLVSSPEFESGSSIVGWLSLSFVIVIISSALNIGPVVMKKTIYNTYSYIISMVVNFTCLFILVPRIGILGAAMSLVMGNVVLLMLSWYFSERLYPVFSNKNSIPFK